MNNPLHYNKNKNMFNTKGQEVSTTQKSFEPGHVYAHVYSTAVKTSSKSGKKALEIVFEGPAITGFTGWPIDKNNPEGPKFAGMSSRMIATTWIDDHSSSNIAKNEIMSKLITMASFMGLKTEVDEVNATTIEDWVEKVTKIIKGHNIWFFFKGFEEEYDGKTRVKLTLPKFKFCSDDKSKLETFDKSNVYHFKPLPGSTPVTGFAPIQEDFEM